MELNLDRVRANVQAATTEDLLDRATAYSHGMEPAALDLIEQELWRRGLTPKDLENHAQMQRKGLVDSRGIAYRCHRCSQPAVWSGWRWYHLWGRIPVFPFWIRLCGDHALVND